MIINQDTYISLEDATLYLNGHYISTDAKLLKWNALTPADKTVLLVKAAQIIDRQPLSGVRVVYNQLMEFPRTNRKIDYDNINFVVTKAIPLEVGYAQCEIAIDQGLSERAELQRQGVTSFSIGKLSESYSGGSRDILSHEAKKLLAPWLGSLRIV